jgi:magnesium chelatase family protein
MRERVVGAREIQRARFAGTSTRQNGQMTHRQIRSFCPLDEPCMNLLRATMTELGLSARAHDKILRLARTIADLDAAESISPAHISEAINYRTLDRSLWT